MSFCYIPKIHSQQRYITHTDPLQSPTAGLFTNNIT
jgi:hypothetical protein